MYVLFFVNRSFQFLILCFAAFKLIPPEGLNPPTEIFLGDSAYTRANLDNGILVRTPTFLPEDGSALKVRICNSF